MKKNVFRVCALTFILLVGVGGFFIGRYTAPQPKEPESTVAEPTEGLTIYATVEEINGNGLLVNGLADGWSKYWFTVQEDTDLVKWGKKISIDEIAVGNMVAITYVGVIQESYPAEILEVVFVKVLDD